MHGGWSWVWCSKYCLYRSLTAADLGWSSSLLSFRHCDSTWIHTIRLHAEKPMGSSSSIRYRSSYTPSSVPLRFQNKRQRLTWNALSTRLWESAWPYIVGSISRSFTLGEQRMTGRTLRIRPTCQEAYQSMILGRERERKTYPDLEVNGICRVQAEVSKRILK